MMKITDFSAQEPEGIEKRHNTTAIQVVDGVKRLINVQTGEELYSLTHGRFNSYHYKNGIFVLLEDVYNDNILVTFVTVYDADENKFIFKDYLKTKREFNFSDDLLVVKNPTTKRIHLLDLNHLEESKKDASLGFLDMVRLSKENSADSYYSLINDKRKRQVCVVDRGVIDKKEYDNIRAEGYFFVITEGNKEYYAEGYYENNKQEFYISKTGPKSDKVWADKEFVYCKNDNIIDVYSHSIEKIFTVEADNITLFDSGDYKNMFDGSEIRSFYFDVQRGDKHALGRSRVGFNSERTHIYDELTETKYFEFKKIANDYYELTGDHCVSAVFDPLSNPLLVDNNYEDYHRLKGCTLYSFEHCGLEDLIDASNGNVLVQDCKVLENDYYHVVFERNGKKGILWETNKPKITEGYDTVERLWYGYYKVTKDGKEGIVFYGNEIVPPIYKSVKIHTRNLERYKHEINFYPKYMYLELENMDGTKEVARYDTGSGAPSKELIPVDTTDITRIEFYKEMVVYRTEDKTYIYSYLGELFYTFEGNKLITEKEYKSDENSEPLNLYIIDGQCYQATYERFVPYYVPSIYRTFIEGQYGSVLVEEIDREKYDNDIQYFRDLSEEDFDQSMLNIYENRPDIKATYPNLVRK